MFSRKVVGAIQIMCILEYLNKEKTLTSEIKKQCTLDDNTFRHVVHILSKFKYIKRTMSSPIYLTLKVSLDELSLYEVIQACHTDIEIGEIYSLIHEPIYNYRYLVSWNELTRVEKQLKEDFIEHLKSIKLIQLKPTSICHNTEHYF